MDGIDLEQPYGNLPMVRRRCPYENDLMWVKMSVPIKMIRIDEIWTRISEMKWIEWNEWFEGFDFVNPMGISLWSEEGEPYESDLSESNGNLPMSWEWVYLSIWLDWSQWESPYVQLNECPYQSDLEQPYGKVPMVDWECPYQNDLNDLNEKVPIKMIRFDEIWARISE